MCKYCGKARGWRPEGHYELAPYGGMQIIFDPEDVGWLLKVSNGMTYSIEYCPWCGRKLTPPAPLVDTPEFSTEDEIERLDGRINYTNKQLARVAMLLEDALRESWGAKPFPPNHKFTLFKLDQIVRVLSDERGDEDE